MSLNKGTFLALVLAVCAPTAVASQQQNSPTRQDSIQVVRLAPITVTATRTEISTFQAPRPVDVIGAAQIRQLQPNVVTDMLRGMPGVDVTGVGPSQGRPSIRGQRGQRILLMEDGIRLNNSRRQQDFGELPGLVDVNNVERLEVVRGPASVLYGSDAIGGVVNLITRTPRFDGVHGEAGYRYSSHDTQHRVTGALRGRSGRFSFMANGSFRDSDSYRAPSGSFGNISLSDDVEVRDSGVRDENYSTYVGFEPADGQKIHVRFERYASDSAGFGFVEPDQIAPGSARIRITYPTQEFNKLSFGYDGRSLNLPIADRVRATFYGQGNERQFNLNVFAPVPQAPPGAGIDVATENFTDLRTFGFRVENQKFIGSSNLLTYGVDFFRDLSENTDSSTVTVVGFGPPTVQATNMALVPNASFRSLGAFAQLEIPIYPSWRFTVGGRYQDVNAATRVTPGINDALVNRTDRTVVGAANIVYQVSSDLNIIAAVGRAFRSPNLVERFFHGPTPEGGAFQVRNPGLEPETSLNVDLGTRLRGDRFAVEAFLFRNEVRNGIIIVPTGNTVAGLPEFRNDNSEKLRFTGFELAGSFRPVAGLTVAANLSFLDTENVEQPELPVGDTYRTKLAGSIRYDGASDRFWVEYHVRHNGERDDVQLINNPIGDVLPSFTRHDIRAGALVFRSGTIEHRVGIAVTNLTDALFAEFANASFFRPEARRGVTVNYGVSF